LGPGTSDRCDGEEAEPIIGAWPGDRCKLIEKITKTAVFGLDKIQERLGTNNQF